MANWAKSQAFGLYSDGNIPRAVYYSYGLAWGLSAYGRGSDWDVFINSIHLTFSAKDADAAEAAFRELRDESRKEPGVIQYDVGRSIDSPETFALWEIYSDKAAFEAHHDSVHFQRIFVSGLAALVQQRNAAQVVPI